MASHRKSVFVATVNLSGERSGPGIGRTLSTAPTAAGRAKASLYLLSL